MTMVESWGIGYPDFSNPVGRTQLLATQTPVTIGAEIIVPPGTISFTVYTVPTAKRFTLGYIKSSTSINCIIPSSFLKNGVSFCPLFSQGMVIDQLPDTSGFVFNEGDTLGFIGTNPLAVPLGVAVCLSGFLDDM
jgi:hypothetical protein